MSQFTFTRKLAALLLPLLTVIATPALAEEDETKAADDKKARAEVKENNLSTNIIGSEEAPTVVNVVPWKERGNKMEQQDARPSVLVQILEPLDRDVVKREIEYFKVLKESGR